MHLCYLICAWVMQISWWLCCKTIESCWTLNRSAPLPNRSLQITFTSDSSKWFSGSWFGVLRVDTLYFSQVMVWFYYHADILCWLTSMGTDGFSESVRLDFILQVVLLCDAPRWSGWREVAGFAPPGYRALRESQDSRSSEHSSSDVLLSCCRGCQEKNVHKTLQGGTQAELCLLCLGLSELVLMLTRALLSSVGRCVSQGRKAIIWGWEVKKGILWEII